jgi:hypothetical protein
MHGATIKVRDTGVLKISWQCMTFLYLTSELGLGGQSESTNSQGPMLFEETSYIKLNQAKLFTAVREERETVEQCIFFFFFARITHKL